MKKSLKKRVLRYLIDHPEATTKEVYMVFGDYNKRTLFSYYCEFNRYKKGNDRKEELLKRLFVMVKTKMQPTRQLKEEELDLLLTIERGIVTGEYV